MFSLDRLEPLGLGSLRWPNFSEEDLKGTVQGQKPGTVPGEGRPHLCGRGRSDN